MANDAWPEALRGERALWGLLPGRRQSSQQVLKECRVIGEGIDVGVERQVVASLGKGLQRASTHKTVRSALVRIPVVRVGKQSAALSIEENQEEVPSLGRDAVLGNDGRGESSYGGVEPGGPNGGVSGTRKGLGEGFVGVDSVAPPRLRVPRANQGTADRLGSQLPSQLMVAGPLVRARCLPHVIQATRKVEPHFIRYRLPEMKTGTDGSIERRGLIGVAQSDAK